MWTEVNGLRVHARYFPGPQRGKTTPIVLVHGLGMSSRYMLPLAAHLAPHMPVYVPDLPGSGRSERPRAFLSVRQLADILAGWTSATDLRRSVFLGNSLGCEILVDLAVHHPDRVQALILQGPTPDPRHLSPLQHLGRFLLTGLFERPSLGWVAVSEYLRFGFRRYYWTFRDMIANRVEDKLPLVQAPTLVVCGTRDYLVPRRSVRAVADRLPRGELEVIPGAAHGMNYSHPALLAECVLDFLQRRQSGR